MGKVPKIGEPVIYHDPYGRPHDALITDVHSGPAWSFDHSPCVNLLWVSGDENKRDGYGRQTERQSSVTHGKMPGHAHGNYYRFADESPIPIP